MSVETTQSNLSHVIHRVSDWIASLLFDTTPHKVFPYYLHITCSWNLPDHLTQHFQSGSLGDTLFNHLFGLEVLQNSWDTETKSTSHFAPSANLVSEPQQPKTEPDHLNSTSTTAVLPQWVQDSCEAIQNGDIKLCSTGVGGTYFVYVNNNIISVFKPLDEEPGAPSNPKNMVVNPILPWGKGALREVAAYAIDNSFSGVPETYFVETKNSEGILKKGSLQKFIPNDGDCSDLGANSFTVDDVHRIGVFDIRTLNMDRNDENILVQKKRQRGIQVDSN